MVTATADADEARAVMRLGWLVAETRGRYRLGDDPRLRSGTLVDRAAGVLPLAAERSPAEQRIETETVFTVVVREQELDLLAMEDLGVARGLLESDADTATAYMTSLAKRLAAARKASNHKGADDILGQLNELFYRWDAKIQDHLATGPYGRASAYQLARGLAETYWALDSNAAASSYESWDHLLVQRFNALADLLRRSAHLLPDLAAETIMATAEQWRGVAAEVGRRERDSSASPLTKAEEAKRTDAAAILRLQVALWRDLLLSGNPPTALVATDQTWRRARSLGPLIRSFAVESAGLLAGLLLAGGAVLFATLAGPGVEKALGATFAGIAGAFGLTWSAVTARAKTVGQGILNQLRAKVTADAVIAAATYLPESYSKRKSSLRHSASGASARHIGPVAKYAE